MNPHGFVAALAGAAFLSGVPELATLSQVSAYAAHAPRRREDPQESPAAPEPVEAEEPLVIELVEVDGVWTRRT